MAGEEDNDHRNVTTRNEPSFAAQPFNSDNSIEVALYHQALSLHKSLSPFSLRHLFRFSVFPAFCYCTTNGFSIRYRKGGPMDLMKLDRDPTQPATNRPAHEGKRKLTKGRGRRRRRSRGGQGRQGHASLRLMERKEWKAREKTTREKAANDWWGDVRRKSGLVK